MVHLLAGILAGYSGPGIMGKLGNVIERVAIAQRGCTIEADHLALNTPETNR